MKLDLLTINDYVLIQLDVKISTKTLCWFGIGLGVRDDRSYIGFTFYRPIDDDPIHFETTWLGRLKAWG